MDLSDQTALSSHPVLGRTSCENLENLLTLCTQHTRTLTNSNENMHLSRMLRLTEVMGVSDVCSTEPGRGQEAQCAVAIIINTI